MGPDFKQALDVPAVPEIIGALLKIESVLHLGEFSVVLRLEFGPVCFQCLIHAPSSAKI